MNKKHILLISFIFIGLLSMNFHCGKDEPFKPYDHNFEVAVDIYPLKKSYSLTDTIWLQTDLPTKELFDINTNQLVLSDTGMIRLSGGFNEFGTLIVYPANGFCDVITDNGVNINRNNSQTGSSGSTDPYGCGKPNYTCRIGFKPNQLGIYYLSVGSDFILESCPNKIIPYYASLGFRYKNVDLNLDVFATIPQNDFGGNSNIKYFHDRITDRKIFVFKVE